MTTRLLTVFAFFTSFALAAQDETAKAALAPCGTVSSIDPWMLAYLSEPTAYNRSSDTLYVALKIHLVANDNGTGRFGANRLLDAFNRLNLDFEQAKVQFYMVGDWNLVNNSAWFNHDDIPSGYAMMLANDVPNAVNSYFVNDPAGNCGYNLPYASVVMAHGCSGANDHTWTHEIGHNLTLPHPFRGWEGTLYNPSLPTPDTLLYDYTYFHSQPDTIVPAPLDTTVSERVDQSNCLVAADYICDTPPDYLAYRWDCDANGQSPVVQQDVNGATFRSDGTLYMSYSNDACMTRFSDQQIDILRANLLNVKTSYLTPESPAPPLAGNPVPEAPIGNAEVGNQNIALSWTAVEGADRYLVQCSRFPSFTIRDFEGVFSDTAGVVPSLFNNFTYFWRVRPFNAMRVGAFGPNGQFKTNASVSVNDVGAGGAWRCYPTLLEAGQPLFLSAPETLRGARCYVFDAVGRLMHEQELSGGDQQLALPSGRWAPGMYRLVLVDAQSTGSAVFVLR